MGQNSFNPIHLPSPKPWRELAVFCLMVMELCWVVPWYRSLTPATYAAVPLRVFLVLDGLFLFVYLTIRLMNFLHLRMDLRRGVLAVIFLLCVLVGIKTLLYSNESLPVEELVTRPMQAFSDVAELLPDEFFVAIAALVAGWRGIVLAQAIIGPQVVQRHFQTGIFMFLIYIFINTIITGETPGAFIYVYLFSSLIAMGSARITVIGNLRGGGRNPFDLRWFSGMVVATLAVVGLATLVADVASEDFGDVGHIVGLLFQLVVLLLFIILSPILFLLPFLIERLQDASFVADNLLKALEDLRVLVYGIAGGLSTFLEKSGILITLPKLKPLLLWIVLVAIAFLGIATLTKLLVRVRQIQEEDRQSLLVSGDLWQIFRDSLRQQLRRIGEGLAGYAHLRHPQSLLAAARIRRIYVQLMEMSERLGAPRPAAHTPLEFLPSLEATFPDHDLDLESITHAYLRVRYGELPENRKEVEEVEAAWERVEAYGFEQLNAKKRTGSR